MKVVAPVALLRKFQALADARLRRRLVADTLAELEPRSTAQFLEHLLEGLDLPELRALYLDAALALLDPAILSEELRAAVRLVLEAEPGHPVSVLLSQVVGTSAPPRARPPGYDLEEMPLGVRKAHARRRDRDMLSRLAADPDPSVIAILLDNPFVTEVEVLKVASLRPQNSAIFGVVVTSTRFGVRESVIAALVQNPWCPVRMALALLPLVSAARLRAVQSSPRLDPRLHDAAKVLLSRRL